MVLCLRSGLVHHPDSQTCLFDNTWPNVNRAGRQRRLLATVPTVSAAPPAAGITVGQSRKIIRELISTIRDENAGLQMRVESQEKKLSLLESLLE